MREGTESRGYTPNTFVLIIVKKKKKKTRYEARRASAAGAVSFDPS